MYIIPQQAAHPIKTKKKVCFIDLVRPEFSLPWDEAFEVYKWMVGTARNYRSHRLRYGEPYGHDAIALLNRQPTLVGTDKYDKAFRKDWREDLLKRFQYVLLSRFAQPEADRWRRENSIDINKSRILPIRYYSESHPRYWTPHFSGKTILNSSSQILAALFELEGTTLRESYNPCHPQARTIIEIKFSVYPTYTVTIAYGYKKEFGDPCASRWYKDVAGVEGDLFWDWINRSYTEVIKLLETGVGIPKRKRDRPSTGNRSRLPNMATCPNDSQNCHARLQLVSASAAGVDALKALINIDSV